MAINPAGVIIAGIRLDGSCYSTDNGSTWIQQNEGFCRYGNWGVSVWTLIWDRHGRFYAFTDSGLFRTSILPETGGVPPPSGFHCDIFPNPTVGSSAVMVRTGEAASGTIRISSLHGATVREFRFSVPSAGVHMIPLNLGRLPSGSFIVRVETGTTITTSRLNVTR